MNLRVHNRFYQVALAVELLHNNNTEYVQGEVLLLPTDKYTVLLHSNQYS